MDAQDTHYLQYFWGEKGDLERCCDWPRLREMLARERPDILYAWYQHKNAMSTLSRLIGELPHDGPDS